MQCEKTRSSKPARKTLTFTTPEKDLQTLLDHYNLSVSHTVRFPQFNILPREVELSLLILEKHNMEVLLQLVEKAEN